MPGYCKGLNVVNVSPREIPKGRCGTSEVKLEDLSGL